MMTALMVLFLVVMSVALLAVTKKVSEQERAETEHRQDIAEIMRRFEQAADRYEGIRIDLSRAVIDFGDRARFAFGKWNLSPEQESVLRQFVPDILTLANDELGRRVMKRIVVEGYTDRTGSYLSNLNLSAAQPAGVVRHVRALWCSSVDGRPESRCPQSVPGWGYSFNASRESAEESRRVEMRIEFLGIGERRADPVPLPMILASVLCDECPSAAGTPAGAIHPGCLCPQPPVA